MLGQALGILFSKRCFCFSEIATVNAPQTIVEAVAKSNVRTKERMLEKISHFMKGKISGKTVCVLGITFKPNTDDMREAPSIGIINFLKSQNATRYVFMILRVKERVSKCFTKFIGSKILMMLLATQTY